MFNRLNWREVGSNCAVPAGTYKGKRYYRYRVWLQDGSNAHATLQVQDCGYITVKAPTAKAALDYAEREFNVPAATLTTVGPKGGIKERFVSWERHIGNQLLGG